MDNTTLDSLLDIIPAEIITQIVTCADSVTRARLCSVSKQLYPLARSVSRANWQMGPNLCELVSKKAINAYDYFDHVVDTCSAATSNFVYYDHNAMYYHNAAVTFTSGTLVNMERKCVAGCSRYESELARGHNIAQSAHSMICTFTFTMMLLNKLAIIVDDYHLFALTCAQLMKHNVALNLEQRAVLSCHHSRDILAEIMRRQPLGYHAVRCIADYETPIESVRIVLDELFKVKDFNVRTFISDFPRTNLLGLIRTHIDHKEVAKVRLFSEYLDKQCIKECLNLALSRNLPHCANALINKAQLSQKWISKSFLRCIDCRYVAEKMDAMAKEFQSRMGKFAVNCIDVLCKYAHEQYPQEYFQIIEAALVYHETTTVPLELVTVKKYMRAATVYATTDDEVLILVKMIAAHENHYRTYMALGELINAIVELEREPPYNTIIAALSGKLATWLRKLRNRNVAKKWIAANPMLVIETADEYYKRYASAHLRELLICRDNFIKIKRGLD